MKMIAEGNRTAFQEVYQRYAKLVFGYSVKIMKDRSRAEDITQEVWIKIVRLAGSYRGEGTLKGWLLKTTRNTALNHFRAAAQKQTEPIEELKEEPGHAQECEDKLLRSLEIADLVKKVNLLPDQQRVALLLWISEKLSYDEIAREMALTESAVKSLIFRARRALEEGQ